MKDATKKTEDAKTRLIEAAAEVFARRGFRAATIREICRKANMHVGAVNYHFRDKEGLYSAILEYSHRMATRKYPPDAGLTEDATPEDKLRAFIFSFLSRLLSEGFPSWYGKLMAREISDPTRALDEMVERSIRPLYNLLVGIVQEFLHEERRPDPEDGNLVHLCAMSIVGQCLHYYHARNVMARLRPQQTDPVRVETLADHITRFSISGIQGFAAGDPSK